MLYEDPTKELSSDERFHVELHFSPGVNCCIAKDLPPGPGFRPQSRRQRNPEEDQQPKSEQPPPPLVCTVKCSKESFHKVFDQQSSDPQDDPKQATTSPITIKVSPSDPQETEKTDELLTSKVDT